MTDTMPAAVFKGKGRLEIEQRPVPHIQHDDEVILEVGGVGICGSDLHIIDRPEGHPAKPGVIMGHEFAGSVASVGDGVTNLKPGEGFGSAVRCGVTQCQTFSYFRFIMLNCFLYSVVFALAQL